MSDRESKISTTSSDAPSDVSEGEIQANWSQRPHDGQVEVVRGPYKGRKGVVIRRKSTLAGNHISSWRYMVKLNATYDEHGVVVVQEEDQVVFLHVYLKPRSRA
ncbi:hypothetical protein SCP_0800040 [Sparassis crispa]|uniref:KOW domain-containing protein n=1 Tax=Sparassis crispa TaxID=139825 RepID=A0A401GTE4_9APHY|nr:hypothetical protein SCP_0800040 [Sparassis crispa]GBE85487.1 hypothetical protein SCP_0800040 [Sparassis crispa]